MIEAIAIEAIETIALAGLLFGILVCVSRNLNHRRGVRMEREESKRERGTEGVVDEALRASERARESVEAIRDEVNGASV